MYTSIRLDERKTMWQNQRSISNSEEVIDEKLSRKLTREMELF